MNHRQHYVELNTAPEPSAGQILAGAAVTGAATLAAILFLFTL